MTIDSDVFVLKVMLEMRNRGVYGSVLIKSDAICLGLLMEIYLTSTLVQKTLSMWSILVVNEMRQSLIFLL